jgi:hypothetical protein
MWSEDCTFIWHLHGCEFGVIDKEQYNPFIKLFINAKTPICDSLKYICEPYYLNISLPVPQEIIITNHVIPLKPLREKGQH